VLSPSEATKVVETIHRSFSHIGSRNMFLYLKGCFWCPSLSHVCKQCCDQCIICLQRKVVRTASCSKMTIQKADLLDKVYADIAGPFPQSGGFKYVLAFVDSFSDFPLFVPMKDISSESISDAFYSKWICLFGAPNQFHTDNAPCFSGPSMRKIFHDFSIHHTTSSPYHPQGNAKVERMMRTLKDMLYSVIKEKQQEWISALPCVEMTIRGFKHDSRGFSPFHLLFGKQMNFKSCPSVSNFPPHMIKSFCDAILKESKSYEAKPSSIKIGSLVMLRIFPKTHSIFLPRFCGPARVTNISSQGKQIEAVDMFGKQFVRNISDVKPIHNDINLCNKKKTTKYEAIPVSRNDTMQSDVVPQNRYPSRSRRPVSRYGYDS